MNTTESAAPRVGIARRIEPTERTPWLLGFLCVLIPALPTYVVLAGPLKSNGSPARIVAVILFGLVLLGFVSIRRTTTPRTASPGKMIILLYFFALLLIYGVGLLHWDFSDPVVAANRTRAIVTAFAYAGIALYVMDRIKTPRQRAIILGCLATGLTFNCIVGVLQSSTTIDLRMIFQPPGFVVNADPRFLELVNRGGAVRVMGTSQHAIEFSTLAAVTIPLTLHLARYTATRWRRAFAAAGCCVALLAVPAAVSRTGAISLVTVLLVYMLAFKVRQLALAIVVGSIAFAGYVAIFPQIASALWGTITGSEEDPSIRARTEDYAGVSRTFHEHPVFGLGLGGEPRLLDNEWLQAIVQGGVIGLSAMLLLVVGGVLGISARLRRATSPRERDEAYMLGSMIAGIMVSSTTFDLLHYQQASLILFIVFGLLWSTFTVPVTGRNETLFSLSA